MFRWTIITPTYANIYISGNFKYLEPLLAVFYSYTLKGNDLLDGFGEVMILEGPNVEPVGELDVN